MPSPSLSPSLTVSDLSSESSWSDLPEASIPDLPPVEESPDKPVKGMPICLACGDPIIREPGARGRVPKYHPEHRPFTAASNGPALRRSNKAEAEATDFINYLKPKLVQIAIMVAMADKYDAFCIMVGIPGFCKNLHSVLQANDTWRAKALSSMSGGSMAGLMLSVLSIGAPIAAHHGLIPGKGIAKILTDMPTSMFKLQKQMAEGEAGLTKLMEEQYEASQKKPDAATT